MRKVERELSKLVTDEGLELVSIDKSKRNAHYKLTVKAPDGTTHLLFCASSTGDKRSSKNLRAMVRRLAVGRKP